VVEHTVVGSDPALLAVAWLSTWLWAVLRPKSSFAPD
jgi:hypothetical protein